MIEFRHYRYGPFLLALAVVCAAEKVRAQENDPAPNGLPVIINRKQAAGLSLAHPAPEYPAVAKVNYLQGRVELELTVNGQGKVASAHVVEGEAILAVSALKAALRWVYRPLATTAGPSGFITTVELKFTLLYKESELTPRQAERDFLRQVKPPQAVPPGEDAPPGTVVHLRLLVNDQGQVVDMEGAPTDRAQFAAARDTLQGWTFRPARWGALPIASYLDVDVPVRASSIASAAANAVGR
jgi:TonB family protein